MPPGVVCGDLIKTEKREREKPSIIHSALIYKGNIGQIKPHILKA